MNELHEPQPISSFVYELEVKSYESNTASQLCFPCKRKFALLLLVENVRSGFVSWPKLNSIVIFVIHMRLFRNFKLSVHFSVDLYGLDCHTRLL